MARKCGACIVGTGLTIAGTRGTMAVAAPGAREALARLRRLAADRPVTLLTATKDVELSQAAVLAELLRKPA